MKRVVVGAGLVLLVLAVMVVSTVDAAQIKIGVVDVNTVIGQSDAGKAANDSLARLVQNKQADLNQRKKTIDEMRKELEEQSASAKVPNEKTLELDQLEKDLQTLIAEAQNDIDKKAQEHRNLVLEDIGKVLAILAEEGGYHLIVDSSTAFYYSRLVDITWEVIRKYNDLFEKANQAAKATGQEQ